MKSGLIAAAVLLSVSPQSACAGEIRHGSVDYDRGVYTVAFEAVVMAPSAQVYQLLTDYAHLNRLNESILESAVIKQFSPSHHTTRLLLHTCILFFCQKMVLQEDVQTDGAHEIRAVVLPDASDFSQGMSHWTISSLDEHKSYLTLHRKLKPAFWIPPVIGPWLIRSKMLQELAVLIERLEYYAEETTGR